MNKATTFETTYTRYSFAPLVTLGLKLAKWIKGSAVRAGNSGKSAGVSGAVGHAV